MAIQPTINVQLFRIDTNMLLKRHIVVEDSDSDSDEDEDELSEMRVD